eukprot:CAMPEP_0195517158 /NCGR_PEP_ID=MMETSP0794_2-20130614/10103_1 /TAXON_ID=515487 /ORGANISM="Stephanopyxis turris, Strain CCMP 815" /LENGTH=525 /DNA_ID=CAMNT_0040645923 /DNA_START=98 /DNA_END=1675 /DNA_ORIENTATION=+
MKLLLAATMVASAAAASAGTCADTPTPHTKFDDANPIDTPKAHDSDDCCSACAENSECKAWTFEAAGLARSARCYLHSSDSLPTHSGGSFTCATHSPATPAPSSAPSPAAPPGEGQNWVVIAAGSKTYGNYRHQADACHAYQVVKAGGVPESNIILMMEDDVANDQENPFPGKLFNKPTAEGTPGVDVYDGCKVDYKGSVVTAQLFLDVITGNAEKAGGKVLKSGPNDKVFINFVDHGGAGIIEFPNGDFLHAKDLNDGLQTMHDNKMYKKLVFYMEACESGSMFQGLLPTDINVFATTAANAEESSWGTYCPPDDMVNGKSLNSCLGDLYSVNWMEDADTQTGLDRTLEEQYEYIVKVTNKSHPLQFGTTTFESDKVADYLAPKKEGDDDDEDVTGEDAPVRRAVDTHDIELVQDFYKYIRAESQGKTADEKKALAEQLVSLIESRQAADERFSTLADTVSTMEPEFDADTSSIDADCVKTAYTAFADSCGGFDSYSLKYSHQIADLCLTYSADTVTKVVDELC